MEMRAISLEESAYVMFHSVHKVLCAISQHVKAPGEEVTAEVHSLVREILCVA